MEVTRSINNLEITKFEWTSIFDTCSLTAITLYHYIEKKYRSQIQHHIKRGKIYTNKNIPISLGPDAFVSLSLR